MTTTTQMTTVPLHLQIMRDITGTKEFAGSANNPVILGWGDTISKQFPEMERYCDTYTNDEIKWCGWTVGYVMAAAGIRPIFGPTDLHRFMWAAAWSEFGEEVTAPELGDVMVLDGHVTLFDGYVDGDDNYVRGRGGNQADQVKVSNYLKSKILHYRRAPKAVVAPVVVLPSSDEVVAPSTTTRPTLQVGSTGPDVVVVQTCLQAIPIDGDFGSITKNAVVVFQQQQHLVADGVVGPKTWAALEREFNIPPALPPKPTQPRPMPPPFTPEEIAAITGIAEQSSIASYSWRDRGKAPAGYIGGMAIAFAHVYRRLMMNDSSVIVMASSAANGNPNTDALVWYAPEFEKLGMRNDTSGADTLRHLFVMMLGLGMRETSGEHCQGRDQSANNTDAMTCEAGLFQVSWNISSSSPEMDKLMKDYEGYPPQCYLDIFKKDVSCSTSNWKCYGSGEGFTYQEMAKKCPQFAVEVAGVGMRKLRKHWGPINRKEVELRKEANNMFREVLTYVETRFGAATV